MMYLFIRSLMVLAALNAVLEGDVILYPTQDRDVYQGSGLPTSTPESLGVSSSAAFGGGHSQKSLIQFDVRQQTVGMTGGEVDSAKLRLYVMRPEVYPRGYAIGGTIRLHFQKTAWSETILYWATFNPGAQVASLNLVSYHDLGDGSGTWVYPLATWVEVDVTDAVRQWLDGGVANHGLAMLPDEEQSPFLSAVFADSMTGFKPQLVIKRRAAGLKVTHFAYDGTMVDLEWTSAAGTTYEVKESVNLVDWEVRRTVTAEGPLTVSRFAGTVFQERRAFYQVMEVTP